MARRAPSVMVVVTECDGPLRVGGGAVHSDGHGRAGALPPRRGRQRERVERPRAEHVAQEHEVAARTTRAAHGGRRQVDRRRGHLPPVRDRRRGVGAGWSGEARGASERDAIARILLARAEGRADAHCGQLPRLDGDHDGGVARLARRAVRLAH
eukprot:5848331-Prymnesium_polylepis.2